MKNAIRTLTMDVPLPVPVFMALCQYRERTGCHQEIHEMTGEAVREWLAAQESRVAAAHAPGALKGYQWKGLFVPHGTVLRAVIDGRNIHATVQGDSILFDGIEVSPSRFVNGAGKPARNAWNTVWLLFPHQSIWKRAADCRSGRPTRQLKTRSALCPALP